MAKQTARSDRSQIKIIPLSKKRFDEAVDLVLRAKLDTREEIVQDFIIRDRDLNYLQQVRFQVTLNTSW